MTRKEAIEFIKNIIGEESGRSIGKEGFYAELIGYHIEALKMAIQALSQEPLENIREEIASHIGGCGFLNDGLDLALEIIDKHIEGR